MTSQAGDPERPNERSKALLIVTTVFGLLYLWFVVVSFIPAPQGNWVSSTVPFEPFELEQIFVKLLFLLFLIGYFAVWKNELIGGSIFLAWWVAMWCMEIFIVAPIKNDGGGGIIMGFPLFVLGVFFVACGLRVRRIRTTPPAP